MPTFRSHPALAAACALALLPALARAQTAVPRCEGNDPARATSTLQLGRDEIDQARAVTGAQRRQHLAAALEYFNQACAAGDASALRERARALSGLERFVEAAQSLDAYRAALPGPAPDADRLRALEQTLAAHVGTLQVESDVPDAEVTVNGVLVGRTPLPRPVRVEPGNVTVSVSAPGRQTWQRTVPVPAVSVTAVRATLEPVAPATVASGGSSPATGPAPASGSAAASEPVRSESPAQSAAVDGAPRDTPGRGGVSPLALATGAAAVVFFGVGIGAELWREDRASAFFDPNTCNGHASMGGTCPTVHSELNAAEAVEVAAWVLAGVGAAGAVALLVRDLSGTAGASADASPRRGRTRFACAPSFAAPGVSCVGTY